MRKYIIDGRNYFIHSRFARFFAKKYELNSEFKDSQAYVGWIREYKDNLIANVYLELRRDLEGVFDYSILRRETCEVIDFISESFDIDKENIFIHFNGCDGFYIYIPDAYTGLSNYNNINKALKKIAQHVKVKTGAESLRDDIYEINSCRLPLESLNKATGLYTVCLSYDMLSSFTHKELIRYARTNDHNLKKACITHFEESVKPVILEIIGGEEKADKSDLENWREGFDTYQDGINKDTVAEFYKLCESDEKVKRIYEEAKEQFNKIFFIGSQLDGLDYVAFSGAAKYDFIKDFVQLLYLDDNNLGYYMLDDTNCVDNTNEVIGRIADHKVDLIMYMSIHAIGSEDFSIILNGHLAKKNFEEIVEIVAMIYMYLRKHDGGL